MNRSPLEHWSDMNQRYLMAQLDVLRAQLDGKPPTGSIDPEILALAGEMPVPPAIETVQQAFGLSPFERDLLLLCAGVEFDVAFARAVNDRNGGSRGGYPTFGMAMASLANPHWSALSPSGPLRRWKLVDVLDGPALTSSPLKVDERVLHFLVGVNYLDERLASLVRIVEPGEALTPSQQEVAERILSQLTAGAAGVAPLVQLVAAEPGNAYPVASRVADMLGMQLASVNATDIPVASRDRLDFVRLCERESAFGALIFLVDCLDLDGAPSTASPAVQFLENMAGPVMAIAAHRFPMAARECIDVSIDPPAPEERKDLWERELHARDIHLNGQVQRIAEQFVLTPRQVRVVASGVETVTGHANEDLIARDIWALCRDQVRPRMDGLAQRIETAAMWNDLVLPEMQKQVLRDIAVHVRQRGWVYGNWGFGRKSRRGLGISALFAGPSGTGKTMAAEVLANELELDLYRIDLSQVVSKYIGETEKNLARLFDAAEGGATILLFDEADALFGARSEVRDSHDRYANIEVSYLLQRMEAYSGLAILTTNLKSGIDHAFLRRIRFVVQFPFPDAEARASIWSAVFPGETPVQDLDLEKLSCLNVAGGNIRNIALNAAFLAAEEREAVQMRHLLHAARSEAAKLERPLSDAEIRGWV